MKEDTIVSLLDSHKRLITLACEQAILNSKDLIKDIVKNAVLEVELERVDSNEYKRPKDE